MKTTHTELREREVIDEIICDCCGRVIKDKENPHNEYLVIDRTWGYFQDAFTDTTNTEAHICPECFRKWTDTFTHKVNKSDDGLKY